jgi:excisionase family DNA binding protein
MAYLTVVEAAGLSGLSPDTIRGLIQSGRLPARFVPADAGPAYLIDSDTLDALALRQKPSPSPTNERDEQQPRESVRLRAALLGLRAALARRQTEPPVDGASPPVGSLSRRRGAGGLSQQELRLLSARVDRLLWAEPDCSVRPSSAHRDALLA